MSSNLHETDPNILFKWNWNLMKVKKKKRMIAIRVLYVAFFCILFLYVSK